VARRTDVGGVGLEGPERIGRSGLMRCQIGSKYKLSERKFLSIV
jgi:hypothetical protein